MFPSRKSHRSIPCTCQELLIKNCHGDQTRKTIFKCIFWLQLKSITYKISIFRNRFHHTCLWRWGQSPWQAMEDSPWPCQIPAHLVQTFASPSWLVAVTNLKKWKLYANGRQHGRGTCPTHCIALGSAAAEPQRLNRAAKKTKTTQFNRIQCVLDIALDSSN